MTLPTMPASGWSARRILIASMMARDSRRSRKSSGITMSSGVTQGGGGFTAGIRGPVMILPLDLSNSQGSEPQSIVAPRAAAPMMMQK